MDINAKKIAYFALALGTLVFSGLTSIGSVAQAHDSLAKQLLPTSKYIIKSTKGCPSDTWCNAVLSWDFGFSQPTVTVEKNDPVLWRVEAVPGKSDIYTIKNTWECPEAFWCNELLSWDAELPQPRVTVDNNPLVEWRIEAVPRKEGLYTIKNTWGCPDDKWCNGFLSWDEGIFHPRATVKKNDPVEWEFFDVEALEEAIKSAIKEYKNDITMVNILCPYCDGQDHGSLSGFVYHHTNSFNLYTNSTNLGRVRLWFETLEDKGPKVISLKDRKEVKLLYDSDEAAIHRLALCIVTKGSWEYNIWQPPLSCA